MAIMPHIKNIVNKATGVTQQQGAGLPTGISYHNKARFTGFGAGGGALAGGAVGAATGAAASDDKLTGALAGGAVGAGLGAGAGGLLARKAHDKAIQLHGQRMVRGNSSTGWGDVAKNRVGDVQAGSQVAKEQEVAKRWGTTQKLSPEQIKKLEDFESSQKVFGDATFSDPASFRKWFQKESIKVHPDRMAQMNASPEQIAAAQNRMAELSRVQSELNSGSITPEMLGWGNWNFVKSSSILSYVAEKRSWKERAIHSGVGALLGGTAGAAIGSGVGGHLGEEHRGKGLVVGGATGALAGGLVGGLRGKNIGEWLSKRTTPSQTTEKATEGAAASTASTAQQTSNTQGSTARTGRNKKRRFDKNKKQDGGKPQGQPQGQNKTSAIWEPPFGSFERETLRLSRLVDAGDPQKTADISASLVYFKQAAMALPSIPTPQFPTGLAKITPRSVSAGPIKPGAVSKSTNATQVHSQPPVVNQNPYQGVKAIPPPSVKR